MNKRQKKKKHHLKWVWQYHIKLKNDARLYRIAKYIEKETNY